MNQIGREMEYCATLQDIILANRRSNRRRNLAQEPFNTPPEGNQPMNELGSVLGQGTANTTPILLSFTIPDGWDGLIKWIILQYTGTNFINNSGSLTWALRVNGLYIKGYHNIKSQFSGTSNGLEINPGIVVKSGNLVEIICSVSNVFVPEGGSELIGGVSGYIYPNGVARTN